MNSPALLVGSLLLVGLALGPARAASILDLQADRSSRSVTLASDGTELHLDDLNPQHGIWYLLEVRPATGPPEIFHLENAEPARRRLGLDARGLLLTSSREAIPCPQRDLLQELREARRSGRSYAPVCDGRLFLRNPVAGHQTTRERVTDFLRDNVWSGEALVVFVRRSFFSDAYLETAELAKEAGDDREAAEATPRAPPAARLDPRVAGRQSDTAELGVEVDGTSAGRMRIGAWYRARAADAVYLSAIRADAVAPDILASHPGRVAPLDEVESRAMSYLIAFDLASHEIGFAMGTDHPRVGWSERAARSPADASLPGPDGFATLAPLVMTGKVNPVNARKTVATIAGGFKRSHGAFKQGPLSQVNRGSHYGFVEKGVLLSRLWPGLATFYVLDDGEVRLGTWSEDAAALASRLRHARQNGVALIERSPAGGPGVPGELVNRWGAGNWSGSQDGRLRALRSGFCLVETPLRHFLIYGYFSSVTPSAMVRVFQAYGCSYALHLDMNALEHTYMALYHDARDGRAVEHLIRGMEVLDLESGGARVPRFVGYADNRDFFYVTRREP